MTGRRRRRRAVVALGLVVGALLWSAPPAGARGEPAIRLDSSEVAAGQPVLVTVEGFESPFVNVVLCGNLAYRGATDCNVTSGVSKEVPRDGRARVLQLIAHPPPAPCPCIVRATASTGDDFAVAPITISGHPVAEPQGVPDGPLVEVEIEVARVDGGVLARLRSSLGGPTGYRATVSVRNVTTAPLANLVLSGSVGSWLDDDVATLDLEPPGVLEPGRTATQEAVVEVPAPSVGEYRFEVVASGAGSSAADTGRARNRPVLLYLLIAVFVGDVAMVATRWRSRRQAARSASGEEQPAVEEWVELPPAPGNPLPA